MEANCTSHSVPPEIYSLILSYLPVKSLLRFRSVCEEWKSIISSRYFASLHLKQYANNRLESRLIALEPLDNLSPVWVNWFDVSQLYGQTLEFDFSGPAEPLISRDILTRIVDHIDGLILLVRRTPDKLRNRGLVIWNPSIRKVLNIPLPPSSKSQLHMNFSMGFDPSTNDYKVVSMDRGDDDKCNHSVEIFSLDSHSWMSKGDVCYQFDDTVPSLSCGGFIHWLLLKGFGKKDLLSFDMGSETFSQKAVPIMLYEPDNIYRLDALIALTGSLIGLLTSCNGITEIWGLDKDECWSKRLRFDAWINEIWLYHKKGGLLIWEGDYNDDDDDDDESIVFASDIGTGKTSATSLGHQFSPIYVGTYIESLVLLN